MPGSFRDFANGSRRGSSWRGRGLRAPESLHRCAQRQRVPFPAAAVGITGPRAELVQQAPRGEAVEETEGAFGLADTGDVEMVLDTLFLVVSFAACDIGSRRRRPCRHGRFP